MRMNTMEETIIIHILALSLKSVMTMGLPRIYSNDDGDNNHNDSNDNDNRDDDDDNNDHSDDENDVNDSKNSYNDHDTSCSNLKVTLYNYITKV